MECNIRSWRISDAPDLAEALNDRKVLDRLRDGLPFPYTEQDARDYIEATLASDPKENFCFAVEICGRAVGSVGAFRRQNIHRQTAELGYYLARPYWGRGLMTRAVGTLCDYIFEFSDIERIFAEPFADNKRSCRVLEKNGFELEGLLRRNAVKNGKTIDMRMYALLRD